MQDDIIMAIHLRENGDLKQSNELLLKLAKQFPDDAVIQYQCACSFDVLGEERKAVPYYESSIKLGLSNENLEGAILGLGSTYRVLGEYEKAKNILQKGVQIFPHNEALKVFYSMVLYNLHEHDKAMEILLNCLIETTNDANILSYEKAIKFYAKQLDKIWD